MLIIFFALYRSLRKTSSEGSMDFMEMMLMMLRYGFPLAVIGIIGGFGGQLSSLLMARYSSTLSVGNYGVASRFLVLVGFISFPVGNVLFPLFSKMSGSEAREGLEVAFRASVKYVSFLMLPAAVGMMAVSQPLIGVLFGGEYSLAPLFLVLLSAGSLFCGLGSVSMGSLLSSQGETWTIFKIGLLNMIIGLPLSFILIPYFGVLGFIVYSLITQAISTVLHVYSVRRLFKFKMWIGQSVRTYVAAFTMGGLVWVTLRVLRSWGGIDNDGILLGVGCLVGFFSYLLLLPLIGAIERADLENLNDVSGMFGFLKPIFSIFFVIMMKVAAIRSHKER
jgi:putative peptidoglycan lipid II flippase